ncbi:SCO family protein [Pseudomonas syringae]|nr:SCO family protein [Pseudomonas syringae]MBD8803183.1 SCO family protein [Pseudomonas syringae]MBD8814003.1 SCO family protein [Pseudomonas syringae]
MLRWLLLISLICTGAGGLYHKAFHPGLDSKPLNNAGIFLFPTPRALPNVQIKSLNNQPFDATFLSGRWTLVLFGYTFCPDICPTALSDLRKIKAALPAPAGTALRVVMVSVDPQRDSAQAMQRYATWFDPTFIGMTGEPEQLRQASITLGLPFVPPPAGETDYIVAHSANLALIDPVGRHLGFVRGPLKVNELIQALPDLLMSQRY